MDPSSPSSSVAFLSSDSLPVNGLRFDLDRPKNPIVYMYVCVGVSVFISSDNERREGESTRSIGRKE